MNNTDLENSNKNEVDLRNPGEIGQGTENSGWQKSKPKNRITGSKIYSKIDKISKPLFWALFVIFVLTAGGVGYYFYSYIINRDIAFSLNAPQNILTGAPFNLEVNAENNFNNTLNDVKISFVLPDGIFFSGESREKRFYDKSFGDLEKGANFQEQIPIIILPNGETLEKIDVKISYYTPTLGAKARFEQTETVEISIGEPALKLDIIAPQKVLNNEDFEIEIHYKNISDAQFENSELKLIYPDFFTFKSATVNPSSGNNIWNFGALPKNSAEGSFVVKGKIINTNESLSNFEIQGELSAGVSGQRYLINKKIAQLNIASSPLSLSISLGDKQNFIAGLGENLRYKINYHNSSDVGLNDIIIVAKLTGEMFDFQTIDGDGFFDSKNNVITWNVANTSNLRVLNPDANGFVEFQVRTKNAYPIKREGDKNFTLNIAAEISSPTIPYYVSSDKTVGFANLKNNVSGAVKIAAKALFYDPSSGINNKGYFPLKVNQPTNFTIYWTITNYSTDISSVRVSAFLQSGIRWTGQVKSSINSVPEYNERTQEVIWNIDKVLATQGVISKPVEAIFQIEATPNVAQIDQVMNLLGKTTIQARDDFNNIDLTHFVEILTSGVNVFE